MSDLGPGASVNPAEQRSDSRLAVLLLILYLPHFLNGFYNPFLGRIPALFWLVDVFVWIVMPAAAVVYCNKRKMIDWQELGFRTTVGNGNSRLFFVLMLIYTPILMSLVYFGSYAAASLVFPVNFGAVSFKYHQMIPKSGAARLLIVVYFSVTAGVFEEVAGRAVFFKISRGVFWNPALYVLISSLLFSAVHWEGGVRNVTVTFVFGAVCAFLYLKTRNLWPLILGHTVTDYIAFTI